MEAKKMRKRPASHAGSWYEDDESTLKEEIEGYLKKGASNSNEVKTTKALKGIIVPHAGYYYCGETAGNAFYAIDPLKYDRVVVIGPSHNEYFKNCALSAFSAYETPFGDIEIDTKTIQSLIDNNKNLFHYASIFLDVQEHSIEMELPFIKYLFDKANKKFTLIPIIVGEANINSHYKIAKALEEIYNDDKTLWVISSDFCHWGLNYDYVYYDKTKGEIWKSIEYIDLLAIEIMGKIKPKELDEYFKKYENTICGRYPISILLCLVEMFDSKKASEAIFKCVKYAQSDKVVNMKQFSVSYAGCVLYI